MFRPKKRTQFKVSEDGRLVIMHVHSHHPLYTGHISPFPDFRTFVVRDHEPGINVVHEFTDGKESKPFYGFTDTCGLLTYNPQEEKLIDAVRREYHRAYRQLKSGW